MKRRKHLQCDHLYDYITSWYPLGVISPKYQKGYAKILRSPDLWNDIPEAAFNCNNMFLPYSHVLSVRFSLQTCLHSICTHYHNALIYVAVIQAGCWSTLHKTCMHALFLFFPQSAFAVTVAAHFLRLFGNQTDRLQSLPWFLAKKKINREFTYPPTVFKNRYTLSTLIDKKKFNCRKCPCQTSQLWQEGRHETVIFYIKKIWSVS